MQRIKKAYAENGDLKIIPETTPLDGSENWEQGRGPYYELDNDPSTGDPLALDINREQDNYFKNVISKNIKHWQENSYPIWFNDIKYPKNAIVKYTNGNIYASKIDNNTELPTNATNWTIYDPSSLDGQFVKLNGNQTIEGIKTFSSSPIVPTPTGDTQAANKAYVDSKTLNINPLSNKPTPNDTDNFALQEVGGLLKKLSFANLMAWVKSFSFGWGQTWQDVTASRSAGVTYTNTTGKPIHIFIQCGSNNSSIMVEGVATKPTTTVSSAVYRWSFSVPVGATYKFTSNNTTVQWLELR